MASSRMDMTMSKMDNMGYKPAHIIAFRFSSGEIVKGARNFLDIQS